MKKIDQRCFPTACVQICLYVCNENFVEFYLSNKRSIYVNNYFFPIAPLYVLNFTHYPQGSSYYVR
jgi:hypothetical protein